MDRLRLWGAAAAAIALLVVIWILSPGLHHPHVATAKFEDKFPNDQFPSTYKPQPSRPVLIRNATVLTGTDREIDQGDVLIADSKIKAVGKGLGAPPGASVVNGT